MQHLDVSPVMAWDFLQSKNPGPREYHHLQKENSTPRLGPKLHPQNIDTKNLGNTFQT